MNFLKSFIVFLCLVFLCTTTGYSFEEKLVHPLINEASSQPEQSRLDESLKEIGFLNGRDELFIGENGVEKRAFDWIKQGGTDEDAGFRALNHFHDPTMPWEDAGLFGMASSSLVWAQKNDASWNIAREHYSQALTSGSQEEYAATFRTLGQLMHLVSDTAVPAHVRDDAHPEVILSGILDITHFEVWTKKNRASLNYNGVSPGQVIFTQAVPNEYSPLSALWDIDQYDTTNPEVTLGPAIGLAEYTNANFFSEGTAFSTKYPYPAKDTSVEKQTVTIPDLVLGGEVEREYWIKKATADTNSYRLAGVGYNTFSVESLYIDGFDDFETFPPMDRYVFQEYANLLIPRAVGYSAALLDYFFRGELEIVSLPIYTKKGYYGLVELNIKNITETEESLTEGTFSLMLQHPNPNYDPNDPTSPSELYIQAFADSDLTVTELSISQLEFDQKKEVYFYLPPLELSADDADLISFMLVYKGGLGSEKNAVIGKHFKPEAVEIFVEEWDSLEGNYPWQHIIEDDSEPSSGTASNSYAETTDSYGDLVTTLVKENVRYAGYDNPRSNRTDLDLTGQNFEITPNTYIQFKIDEMYINEQPPSPPETTSAWQFLSFTFSEGSTIQMSVDGQGVWLDDSTYFYDFWKEHIWRGNIYNLLQKDSSAPSPIFLEKISLTQVLDELDDPSLIQHEQYMEIDSIRLFEAIPQ